MRLELNIISIKDVQFAEKTAISNRVLYINRKELQELLGKDKRFSKVDIELAHPGESCRLVQVFDVTEPRAKMGGTGENFPGALGRLETVGEGHTRVLRGMAVVTIDYTAGSNGMLIDMSGPGVEMGLYGKLQNVVLLCHPANGVDRLDYLNAVGNAGLKAAVYFAEAAEDLPADEIKVYNLEPLAKVGKGMEHLPRVAYVYQIHSLQQPVPKSLNWPIFYGDDTRKLLPTIVHPNEILDGAILGGYTVHGIETYFIQNHPIVQELYNRHGKELCFVGVVVTVAQSTEPERERLAAISAKLVKSVLGADAAILTKIGGGAPHVDLAQTCELCEELGVKTALIAVDQSVDNTCKTALLFNTPRADAVVNVGSMDSLITLPPMEKVVGGPVTFRFSGSSESAEGEINIIPWVLCGAVSHIGASRLMMREVKQEIGKPGEEGYISRCILRRELSGRIAAQRVIDMLLSKVQGKPFETELQLPEFERVKPAGAVKGLSSSKIALVTDGGLVPKGNPDRIEAVNATKYGKYGIKGVDKLNPGDYEVVHLGYDTAAVSQDPHRLAPLDAMRDLEKAGVIGKLCENFYSTTGVGGTLENAGRIAQGIAGKLKAEGVDGVILTST